MSDHWIHDQLRLTTAQRFQYAFRQRVIDLDEDKLALLVGEAMLIVTLLRQAETRPTPPPDIRANLQQVIAAARALYEDLEPGILDALETTAIGRLMVWKATHEQEET